MIILGHNGGGVCGLVVIYALTPSHTLFPVYGPNRALLLPEPIPQFKILPDCIVL